MSSAIIQALKPNVTEKEALDLFSSTRLSTLYWKALRGPLQRVATVYVPFVLYRASYRMNGAPRSSLFAMDAVDGSLDLYAFPKPPESGQLVEVNTRNRLSCSLDSSRAETLLRDKILRAIFQQGFFKLRSFELQLMQASPTFYLSYWLGFYGRERLRCRVMDATRRRIEGAKATAFFEEWLAA